MLKKLTFLLISLLLIPPGFAQNSSSNSKLSSSQLQKLVAPIALYPDPLLAQILPASTYPLEIVQAARVVKKDKDISKIDSQSWDPSVKAVAHYPSVLKMMNDKLDWTQQLGQAVMNQQGDVLQAVQTLRQQAKKQGNLNSNAQQTVTQSDSAIQITSTNPQVIYVPTYDPTVIYTAPAPAVTYGLGFAMGAWMTMGFAWGWGGYGGVVVNNYNWNNWNANNVKNWENNHPNATQDAKNDANNWKNNHPDNAWSHDTSRDSLGASSKADSAFSKGSAADAQKANLNNFENQMKNLNQKNQGIDRGDGGNDLRGGGDRSNFGGDRSAFDARGGDDGMRDSMRGFDSRGGGGFGGFGGGGRGGFGGGGFGGFHGGGRR